MPYLGCDLEAAVSYERQHASVWSPQSKAQGGPYRPAYGSILQLYLKPTSQHLHVLQQLCNEQQCSEEESLNIQTVIA